MEQIDLLISILEKEIECINNNISIIQEVSSEIDTVLDKINDSNIINISGSDVEFIQTHITLNSKELEFLNKVLNFGEETKQFISSTSFDTKQKSIILGIRRNLEALKISTSNNEIEKHNNELNVLKQLIIDLKNQKINIIDKLEYIMHILNKYDISKEEQIKILVEINKINFNIYNSLMNGDNELNDSIDEENMPITNLDENKMIELFAKFNLNFNEIYSDKSIEYEKNKLRLLKRGDYEKIELMLNFLCSNPKLEFVFGKVEILTKVLLHSSVDQIQKLMVSLEENDIEGLLYQQPTILFPPVKECIKIGVGSIPGSSETLSGSMKNCFDNIDLLKSLNISISQAYKKCSTFFVQNVSNPKLALKYLKLYGIDALDDKTNITFTVLKSSSTVQKRLDIAIETGCFDYCKENLSRLGDVTVNLYRVKYAKSKYSDPKISFSQFHKTSTGKIRLNSEFVSKNDKYGDREIDTFELYEAVKLNFDEQEKYDAVIKSSNNVEITSKSLNDPLIRQLDNYFMVEGNKFEYNFNGVIISRFKVLRHYETLISEPGIVPTRDLLLYIISLYSMLNSNEVISINKCLDQITFVGSKRK